jgi:hypothetical protein
VEWRNERYDCRAQLVKPRAPTGIAHKPLRKGAVLTRQEESDKRLFRTLTTGECLRESCTAALWIPGRSASAGSFLSE